MEVGTRTTLLGPSSTARTPKTRPRSHAVLRELVALKASSALSALTSVTHVSPSLSLSTRAVTAPARGSSLPPGGHHSLHPAHRGDCRGARVAPDPRRKASLAVADIASRARLQVPSRLAARGVLYSPARVDRLASPLGRLARCTFGVRRRHGVHAEDLGISGRAWRAVAVVTAGAGLPGLPQVAR